MVYYGNSIKKKLLILGSRDRICINICKRREILQISFFLLIKELLSHQVKAFALVFVACYFGKSLLTSYSLNSISNLFPLNFALKRCFF